MIESSSDDIESMSTPGIGRLGIIALAVMLVLFLFGFIPKVLNARQARSDSKILLETAPNVEVVAPRVNPVASGITLPADVRPFETTALYSRASGFLNKLYVDIGDRVTEGQKLAEIDSPEIDAQLDQAKANLNQSESSLKLAQATLQRYEKFSTTGGVSKQDLDERRTMWNQAQAASNGAKAEVQRLTELKQFTTIVAPFAGIVTARNYDVGALLSPSQTKEIFKLERVDILRVFINVPQSVSSGVTTGADASLVVRNFPGREFAGKVARTTGSIDSSTRTLSVEVDVPNTDGMLMGGMYGSVKLSVTPQKLFLVPTSSIIFDNAGTRVGVVIDSKIQFKPVSLGSDYGNEIEILSGLNGSELVVVNPGLRIAEGKSVTVVSQPKKPG